MHYIHDPKIRSLHQEPLYALHGVSHRYPDGTLALDDVSLTIQPGDRIALVGRNGSGKTTLIRLLAGLLACRQGEIRSRGTVQSGEPTPLQRTRVGVLFQDPDDQLFCNTVNDDVAFGPRNLGLPDDEIERRVWGRLEQVGLEHLRYKAAHHLSYGQKKRAAFAAIMAMEPEVLILDEPTANLDPRQEEVFKELLRAFRGTLIVIDHDLLFLFDLCRRAVVMSQGRVHHDYSFDELVSQPAYLREHGLDFTFRFSCCGGHRHNHAHSHHLHSHDHGDGLAHLPPGAAPSPLIELQHYSFRYPDGSLGLDDVNLAIARGDRLALVGENGAGKSTLAACLLGLHQGQGYYFFDGRPLARDRRPSQLWRRVGIVFQNAADQLFNPSCREEVAFGPYRLGLRGKQLQDRVEAALGRVHLQGFADKVPLNMSGGERKRLAIAAALAMEPEVLILDEPTAGLDPQGEELLLTILRDLQLTIILISHDLFFIGELTQRTVVMHRGSIIRDYRTSEFLADDHLHSINGLDYSYKAECGARILALQNGNHLH
jgi:energy-coupling factor transport system ATP-binding protein